MSESLFAAERWIVAVRNEREDWEFFGLYGSRATAQRKADAVNKLIETAGAEIAYAYVEPLNAANLAAKAIVERATDA